MQTESGRPRDRGEAEPLQISSTMVTSPNLSEKLPVPVCGTGRAQASLDSGVGGRLTFLPHAGVEALPQPAGWAVPPLGLADLTASGKGAAETSAFANCSSVRDGRCEGRGWHWTGGYVRGCGDMLEKICGDMN